MKLSTRSRYGLRAICYLAENDDKGYIPVSEISSKLDLSENYLEQLVRILKQENLVESTRGPKGGYRITRDPKDITAGEVIRVLEGDWNITGCYSDGHCVDKCNAYFAFYKIDEAINDTIDSITLNQIINSKVEVKKWKN